MSIAYYDGQYVERDTIRINPTDFGFARGITLFELARVYGGTPFYLQEHLQRLNRGAKMLNLPLPTLPELSNLTRQVIDRNAYPHSAVKFYLTAGECDRPSGSSYNACEGFTPHLMIFEDEVTPKHPEAPYGLELYKSGQRLKTVPYDRELPMLKTTNYLTGFYAARQVAGADYDDILFTHRDGYITEATRSNFFCVIDDVLVTPQRGMLLGITRHVLLEIATELGINTIERDLFPADLAQATEAFTTGSIAELVPARSIDDNHLATTMDGKIFTALRQAFSAKVQAYSQLVTV
ncbi:aminotransferase class IV [Chamaesiphon minutus]|uniref:Branched-chain amino acid aminotransferase/4-amino-4-deoxychorismate lyase n=1 Tax=Chamaesiphon minutus (strain ATCC 27169 / PCC 6605) TaxID=1173020 RepID=K9UKW2_CHAP6|nr:aminotransferase class IV [Chamaesiphon minutus]AFY95742.1 branched-chain amino acid aminotransferase/4-amino-4-deoxychorismate lyase [Chamaesiphon minutus PCC 6605]